MQKCHLERKEYKSSKAEYFSCFGYLHTPFYVANTNVIQLKPLVTSRKRLEKILHHLFGKDWNLFGIKQKIIRWCVGDGLIDLWFDRWVNDEPLINCIGTKNVPYFLGAEFMETNGWNISRLSHWLPQNVVKQISQIPICQG